jgi:hypothetical protein
VKTPGMTVRARKTYTATKTGSDPAPLAAPAGRPVR